MVAAGLVKKGLFEDAIKMFDLAGVSGCCFYKKKIFCFNFKLFADGGSSTESSVHFIVTSCPSIEYARIVERKAAFDGRGFCQKIFG